MASVFWVVSLMKTSIGSRNNRFDVFLQRLEAHYFPMSRCSFEVRAGDARSTN